MYFQNKNQVKVKLEIDCLINNVSILDRIPSSRTILMPIIKHFDQKAPRKKMTFSKNFQTVVLSNFKQL